MIEKKPIIQEKGFLRNLRHLHPYQTMMYFAMVSSGFLFVVMLVSYSAQRFQAQNVPFDIKLPKAFFLSTAAMLLSAVAIKMAKTFVQRDQLKKCTNSLMVVLGLAIAFSIFQVIGWIEFYKSGFNVPTANVASTYVYVLSSIHLFHVLLAISFLLYVLVPFFKNSRTAVKELILLTNPYQKKKMNMLFVFWYYVDVVWLIMFFYFALTF